MLVEFLVNSAPAVVAALLVAGLCTAILAKIQQNNRIYKLGGRAKLIPSRSFGIGHVLRQIKAANACRNRELWEHRMKEAWTIEMHITGTRVMMTADPENIKAVLASQFHDFGKGEEFHRKWHPFLGDSIFSTDGKEWQGSRQLIRPQFIKDRISDIQTFERHIQHMMMHIPKEGGTVDIQDLLFRYTLDSATEFLLGSSVNSLGVPTVAFAEAFQEIQEHMNNVSRAGPISSMYPTRKFKKNIKILNDFVEPFVQRTLQMNPEDLKEKKDDDYNFLHALAGFTQDPAMLRDQLVAVLLAARDTTAGTLSWMFYELARHPHCVERLRAEILERIGPHQQPTYTDLKEMKYLQHVMNETMRLYPAVPFNLRVAMKDTYLPRGNALDENEPIGLLEGTVVVYSPLVMQRRKDLFGPGENEFIPERWEKWVPKAWTYIPFNGGPRICVGQQFALTEMGYTVCRLLQNFQYIEDRTVGEQGECCNITITPAAPVLVSMRAVAQA